MDATFPVGYCNVNGFQSNSSKSIFQTRAGSFRTHVLCQYALSVYSQFVSLVPVMILFIQTIVLSIAAFGTFSMTAKITQAPSLRYRVSCLLPPFAHVLLVSRVSPSVHDFRHHYDRARPYPYGLSCGISSRSRSMTTSDVERSFVSKPILFHSFTKPVDRFFLPDCIHMAASGNDLYKKVYSGFLSRTRWC